MRNSFVVLLLVLFSLLFLSTRAADELAKDDTSSLSLYSKLWNEVQAIVTPKMPMGTDEESYKPQELFIMNTPGTAIDYEQYDSATWQKNKYEGPDPDLLKFEMTEPIPLRASRFIDSGRKVSWMYRRFLLNYINPKAINTTLNEETQEYKNALSRIFEEDFTKSGLVKTVEAVRDAATETFNRVATVRDECLRNEAPGICAQKMLYYQAEVADQNLLYMVTRKELQGAEATVLALQSRNLDTILAQGMQRFVQGMRSGIGGSTLFGSYMYTVYDPSDFHLWWSPDPATSSKTWKSAFTGVSLYSTKSVQTESSSSSKRAFGVQARSPFFSMSTSGSSEKKNFDAYSGGNTFLLQFEIAQIRVYRPWFDTSLMEYYPLGLDATPINQYSDGNYKGLFPWYISKVIVGRNITIKLDQFSQKMSESFSAMSSSTSTSASFGCFSFSASHSKSNSQRDKSFRFEASGGKIRIDGPQIIGYVVSKMPAFPNWESEPAVPESL